MFPLSYMEINLGNKNTILKLHYIELLGRLTFLNRISWNKIIPWKTVQTFNKNIYIAFSCYIFLISGGNY